MAPYYAVWHGTRGHQAVLVTTTQSLAKAKRIVARYAAVGQPAYITTETGCVMDEGEREVVK